jgi:hypothetical protein
VHIRLTGARVASLGNRETRSRSRLAKQGVFMRKKPSLEGKWHEQAERFKRQAEKLPYGKEREELLRMARQLEIASHINEWVSSPGLSPPK